MATRDVVFRLVSPALVATLLGGCSGAQTKAEDEVPVEVKLRRVEVMDASFERMALKVIVAAANPSSADRPLTGGDASLAIAGRGRPVEDPTMDAEETADGEADDRGEQAEDEAAEAEAGAEDESGIVTGARFSGAAPGGLLAAFKETEVPILVEVSLPEEPGALERLLAWNRMVVDVEGTLQLGGRVETFAGQREVAMPVLPKVVLQEAQVASIDRGQKGAVFFSVGIENPNTFPIRLDRFAWTATVGGKELRVPGEGSSEAVPPSSVANFEDTVQLNEETFGPEVRKLLGQPRVPYRIDGHYEVRGIRRVFSFDGEMEFAR